MLLGAIPASAGLPAQVQVVTTGDNSERYETIPVTKKRGAEPRVAMSLAPGELPELLEGDRLHVTAELQTTNNCFRQSSYCVSRPYDFSPNVGTRLVLSKGLATGGPDARAITARQSRPCDQDPRNREHHCVSVFRGANFRLDDEGSLPCQLHRCRVSLVVDAHHHDAKPGDKLLLGIDRTDGQAHGDRGRLNVARLRGDVESTEWRSERRLHRSVEIKEKRDTAIYSLRLPRLREDEQLTVDAEAIIDISHVSYAAFVGSELILGTSPRAVHTTQFTRNVATLRGQLSEANGFNCTQRRTPCPVRKVGTLVVKRDAERGSDPVPLYVNLVLRNAPKMRDRNPGDHMKIRRGFVEAVRYPAGLNGRR